MNRSGYALCVDAQRLRKVGQALAALSAAFIVFATLSPSVSAGDVDDRLIHFLLFVPLGLGGALWMSVLDPAIQRRARLAVLGLILAFAAATEIGQGFVGRNPSVPDFIADAAGAGLGVLIGSFIAARSRRA